jgi:hypothetical protein
MQGPQRDLSAVTAAPARQHIDRYFICGEARCKTQPELGIVCGGGIRAVTVIIVPMSGLLGMRQRAGPGDAIRHRRCKVNRVSFKNLTGYEIDGLHRSYNLSFRFRAVTSQQRAAFSGVVPRAW